MGLGWGRALQDGTVPFFLTCGVRWDGGTGNRVKNTIQVLQKVANEQQGTACRQPSVCCWRTRCLRV